mmetsp:Transcript_21001/g.31027  ORF Transcript_21001/g.31027 Transcript_21001/m.31027 type:complete len:92 (-) Transcript_21001:49-324(-)
MATVHWLIDKRTIYKWCCTVYAQRGRWDGRWEDAVSKTGVDDTKVMLTQDNPSTPHLSQHHCRQSNRAHVCTARRSWWWRDHNRVGEGLIL